MKSARHLQWLCVVASGACWATTRYVALDGAHVAPFTSWATAARDLQSAVTAAVADDLVLVSNGWYRAGTSGVNMVLIQKRITLKSLSGAAATVIDAQDSNRCFWVDSGPTIDGFTIIRGRTSNVRGGGIYIYRSGTFQNCVIVSNTADGSGFYAFGGGVQCYGGGIVSNCVVADNGSAGSGAGIHCYYGGTALWCRIERNATFGGGGGGGLYLDRGGLARNCTMLFNSARDGGGIDCYDAGVVQNCTIAGNRAAVSAGGVRITGSMLMENTIIYENSAADYDNYDTSLGQPWRCVNCCSTPQSPLTNWVNQIVADPQFAGLSNANVRLLPGSSCIDQGVNAAWMNGVTDLDGTNRILNSIVDLGAYEVQPLAFACNFGTAQREAFVTQDVVFTTTIGGANRTVTFFGWDFDNNGVFDRQGAGLGVVTTSYSVLGTYSVRLLVSNALGQAALLVRPAYVRIGPPIMYVAPDGGDTAPYLSWASAARSPQPAVDLGVAGTVVWLSNTTHVLTNQVTVTHGVMVKGVGGVGATLVRSAFPASTNRCFYLQHPAAQLDGMTIENSHAPSEDPKGGAVHIRLGGTISNCVLRGNRGRSASGAGAYIYKIGTMVDCVVTGNFMTYAGQGGGVFAEDGGLVCNTLVAQNTAESGGGAYMKGGILSNCVVTGNGGSANGGGVVTYIGAHYGGSLVTHCVITNNRTWDYGRGAGVFHTDGTLQDALIADNRAENDYGHGAGVDMSAATMRRCIVSNNVADYAAGVSALDATLERCQIICNRATGPKFKWAGGAWIIRGSTRSCLFACNQTPDTGGGVVFEGGMFYVGVTAMFENCTIVSNSAAVKGGGLWLRGTATGYLFNNIIYANNDPLTNDVFIDNTNCVQAYNCAPVALPGENNIILPPLFVDAAAGNFNLRADSPCRNTGMNHGWMAAARDLEGKPRVLESIVERGAFEFLAGLWCDFSAWPTQTLVDDAVHFTGEVWGTNTLGLYYLWDLNHDGTIEVQGPGSNAPMWGYAEAGQYSVALTVSNALGEAAHATRLDYITVMPEPAGAMLLAALAWCRRRPAL